MYIIVYYSRYNNKRTTAHVTKTAAGKGDGAKAVPQSKAKHESDPGCFKSWNVH